MLWAKILSATCQSKHVNRARARRMAVSDLCDACSDWSTINECRPTVRRDVGDNFRLKFSWCRRQLYVCDIFGQCDSEQAISRYQNATILNFIGAWMTEMVVTAGAIRYAKLQSDHHHQQTNIHSLFYRPDALPVAKPTVS